MPFSARYTRTLSAAVTWKRPVCSSAERKRSSNSSRGTQSGRSPRSGRGGGPVRRSVTNCSRHRPRPPVSWLLVVSGQLIDGSSVVIIPAIVVIAPADHDFIRAGLRRKLQHHVHPIRIIKSVPSSPNGDGHAVERFGILRHPAREGSLVDGV